ncbi:hypothetical protein L9F63_003075, partial [Diploptera punctata]
FQHPSFSCCFDNVCLIIGLNQLLDQGSFLKAYLPVSTVRFLYKCYGDVVSFHFVMIARTIGTDLSFSAYPRVLYFAHIPVNILMFRLYSVGFEQLIDYLILRLGFHSELMVTSCTLFIISFSSLALSSFDLHSINTEFCLILMILFTPILISSGLILFLMSFFMVSLFMLGSVAVAIRTPGVVWLS